MVATEGENYQRHWITNDRLRGAIASTVGGFAAGCLGVFAGHPFDTLKTRLQVNNGSPLMVSGGSMFTVIKDLYRGILPPTLTVGVMAAVNFFVYENTRKFCTRSAFRNSEPGKSDGTDMLAVVCGSASSGVISSIFAAPVSMVKVQQQVVSELGMIATARTLYRTHGGLRVFYRAYTPVFINETCGRSIYFFSYELSKTHFSQWLDDSVRPRQNEQHPLSSSLRVRMMAAAVSGVLSWLSIYPIDVLKSRLQVDLNGEKYGHSMLRCLAITFREGGVSGLTRGLGFTLVRAVPVASTVLPIYEYSRDALLHFL